MSKNRRKKVCVEKNRSRTVSVPKRRLKKSRLKKAILSCVLSRTDVRLSIVNFWLGHFAFILNWLEIVKLITKFWKHFSWLGCCALRYICLESTQTQESKKQTLGARWVPNEQETTKRADRTRWLQHAGENLTITKHIFWKSAILQEDTKKLRYWR